MSEDNREETVDTQDSTTEVAVVSEAEILAGLQNENNQLKYRIEELSEAIANQEALTQQLHEAEQQSNQLRQRYADLALDHAIGEAAVSLGISPTAAEMYRSKFTCEIDTESQPQIEPSPTALLVNELQNNPLLRESLERGRQDRQATAVANGAAEVGQADPTELMIALDRHPSRKAQFIRRHGTQAFIDLAEAARRKGYRG